MYRDFSEKSKNELLGLVSEVENEKLSNFTDWIGDRWYDFESWIGKLNIKNYLNNVNDYHKKVIDKNNATQSSINTIFSKVKSVDASYKNTFSSTKTQLQQWQRYIDELSQIVDPHNGKFNTNYISKRLNKVLDNIREDNIDNIKSYYADILDKGIDGIKYLFRLLSGNPSLSTSITSSLALDILMNSISGEQKADKGSVEDIKTGLTFIANINKNIGKYGNDAGATLSSSVLGYLSTLCGIANSNSNSGLDITSDILSLFKASVSVESGIYKYYEKTLHPYDVVKLDSKFGNTMVGLSIASDVAGIVDSAIDSYKVFVDPNSTAYDRAAESIKTGGSVFKLGGDVYVAYQASTKTLQFVNSASGSSKVVNQILATEQKLKYTTSAAVSQKISKVNTVLGVANVATSTISSGIKRYGDVTADGKFSMVDASSVGVHSSLSGLDTVANSLTLGIVDFDSEKVAVDLETDADDFVKGDSWAANYVRDKDNNAVFRFGVSVGAGAYILGKNAVEGVANGAKTIGSWVSTGWNTMTNLF